MQEFYQPIEDVVATYNEDGWCLLGYMGRWARVCAISRRTRDVGTYIEEFLARCVLVLLHLQFSVCSSQTIVLFSKNQSENEANVSSLILRCAL